MKAGAALFASTLVPVSRETNADAVVRRLSFRHTHTNESLSIAYADGGTYLPEALERVNWLLRDFRNGESHPIDPKLLDQLHQLYEMTRSKAPYQVISAFIQNRSSCISTPERYGIGKRPYCSMTVVPQSAVRMIRP